MRLLIIEDDKETREFLAKSLEAESFSIDTAEDGEKGSYLGRINDYDLIILDNMMPGKNGQEVCRELRESGKTAPILMLSIQSETQQKVNLLNLGADDYLTKPYSFQELLARINVLLRRPRSIQEPILKIADLSLDRSRQEVKRGDHVIYLTRKEFALLEYLLRNPGRVLSRSMLLEHVWDMSGDLFSNTVEVHIMNLRKKIDAHHKVKLIHTVPGRGYKISYPE